MPLHLIAILADTGGRWAAGWTHGGGWWWGPLIPLLWLAALGLIVWLVVRSARSPSPTDTTRAKELLAERYARGELSTDEYRERIDQLR